jgi:hypothetical protein
VGRPAPLNPHRNGSTGPSPLPSPALVSRHSSHGGSPPQPVHPAHRNSYQQPYNPAEQQHRSPPSAQNSPPQLQNQHKNSFTGPQYAVTAPALHSRTPSQVEQQYPQVSPYQQQSPYQGQAQPQTQGPPPLPQKASQRGLREMVRGLGISDSPGATAVDATQLGTEKGNVTTCPVCGNFSGDEQAVSFHVSKHFS